MTVIRVADFFISIQAFLYRLSLCCRTSSKTDKTKLLSKSSSMEKIKAIIIESVKKTLEPKEGILMKRGEYSVSWGMWLKNQAVNVHNRGTEYTQLKFSC